MKRLLLFLAVLMLVSVGCKQEPSAARPPAEEPTAKPDEPKEQCYVYDSKGSVIELNLNYRPNRVIGILRFELAEKDKNKGFVSGQVENGIFIGDYTFQSEGKQSKRQVAFQLQDNKAILGYGDMTSDGTKFKDVTKIKFDSGMPLTKVDCHK